MFPRSLLLADLILQLVMQLRPMLRFVCGALCEAQMSLKLVMIRKPRSPLFPFVSSTELMESI